MDELMVTRVRSSTIPGRPGRSLNSARTNHFIIDEPTYAGGAGEAITPGEAFLAGIAACGVMVLESAARRAGTPFERAEAEIDGVRLKDRPADFQRIDLRFEVTGPTRDQAEALVDVYRQV